VCYKFLIKARVLNKRVQKELEALGKEALAEVQRTVELMNKAGTFAFGMPHVRKLQNPLWEIRVSDRQGIARAVFASVIRDEIVILHAFRKKTQQTPQQAIDLALIVI
jgi:phage-related protein